MASRRLFMEVMQKVPTKNYFCYKNIGANTEELFLYLQLQKVKIFL